MTSFLHAIDTGLRALLYTKYNDILSLENVNTGVILWPKGVAMREMAEKRGEVQLEFINLHRVRTAPSWERMRTPVARRGIRVAHTDGNKTSTITVKAIPVDLGYEVWFWSKDLEKINLISERYLFWQQDNPNLNLLYNDVYSANLDLHFGELVDESTVEDKFERGTIFVLKVPINIDGWIFSSTDIKTIQKIEFTIYDGDDLTASQRNSIVVEMSDSEYDSDLEITLKLYESHIFGIIAVDIDTSTFSVKSGTASEFVVDSDLYVDDSTGNDNKYTIVSATEGEDSTAVVVSETIADSTADGTITLRNYNR